MNHGRTVFAQLLEFVPFSHFEHLVDAYQANKDVSSFSASRPVDTTTGLRADQTILLATPKSKAGYPERLRRVSFRDPETGKPLVFLTNLFDVPALTVAAIYKNRWQIELFFKWLKQNLAVIRARWMDRRSRRQRKNAQ